MKRWNPRCSDRADSRTPVTGNHRAGVLGDARRQQADVAITRNNLSGIGLALVISSVTGALWEDKVQSSGILMRTGMGLAGVALASGAAVLSLVTG